MNAFIACFLLLGVRIANGTPITHSDVERTALGQQAVGQQHVDLPVPAMVHAVEESEEEHVVVQPEYPMKLTDTAKMVQNVAQMAVVDLVQPLHNALYTLETEWFELLQIASERKIHVPSFDRPIVNLNEIFTCKGKHEPKYAAALRYIMDSYPMIIHHAKNASAIAKGLEFVSQLILNEQMHAGILVAATKKLSTFLTDYSQILTGLKATICVDETMVTEGSKPKYDADSPLAIFNEYLQNQEDSDSNQNDDDQHFEIAEGPIMNSAEENKREVDAVNPIAQRHDDRLNQLARGIDDAVRLIG